jgi:DNA-binding FrmR family transcriptional regulator
MFSMSHTIRNKRQIVTRVRRIAGQVAAIEKSLESEDGCNVVLQRIAAARGALNGLMALVIEEHLEVHVVDARSAASRRKAADELLEVVRTYLE